MVVWRFVVASALLAGLIAALARAAGDPVVVRDKRVCRIFALGGTILYERNAGFGCNSGSWVRVINGHHGSVHHLPRGASFSQWFGYPAIALDRHGHPALPFWTGGDYDQQWWIYDITRDRARRVKLRLHDGCGIVALAIWRARTAYASLCGPNYADSGFFLRVGTRQRRLADFRPFWNQGAALVMRGGVLAGTGIDDGDETSVGTLAENDTGCPHLLYLGEIGGPASVWLSPHNVIWTTDSTSLSAARISGGCSPLGPERPLYDIPTGDVVPQAFTVDAPYVYYTDNTGAIRRHRLSGL